MQKLTLWDRMKSLVFTNDSSSTLAAPSADLIQSLMGFPTAAGKVVTRSTAIRVASFLSAVKMLSGDIAKLPLILRSTTNVAGRTRTVPATDEPLYSILRDCPNDWHTSYQMRFYMASQLIMNGNSFAQVIRNGTGKVLALNPLDAWAMTQKWDLSTPGKPVLYWIYNTGQGGMRRFEQKDIWHTTSNNFEGNGVEGSAVIALAKEALSVLMAGEEQAGRTLANSLGMSGFISFPVDSQITEPQAQGVVDRLKKDFSGSQNAGKFTILPGGGQWQNMAFNAKDSQLLESRQWNAQEIARVLGGAPLIVKLGLGENLSTYSAASSFLEDYFNTSLLPHTTAIEQSIMRDLIPQKDRSRLYVKHDSSVVLGGSLRERAETNQILVNSFQMTPNEARISEDRDTIEGGDVCFFPANSGIYDPATGKYFLAAQGTDTEDPEEDPAEDATDTKPESPSEDKPSKKSKGATARLQSLAVNLAERVIRKETKAGVVEPKFVAEVLNVSMRHAEEYCAMRKAGDFNDEQATDYLVELVMGDNYDEN
jgi:HK97 family phage portal protein